MDKSTVGNLVYSAVSSLALMLPWLVYVKNHIDGWSLVVSLIAKALGLLLIIQNAVLMGNLGSYVAFDTSDSFFNTHSSTKWYYYIPGVGLPATLFSKRLPQVTAEYDVQDKATRSEVRRITMVSHLFSFAYAITMAIVMFGLASVESMLMTAGYALYFILYPYIDQAPQDATCNFYL